MALPASVKAPYSGHPESFSSVYPIHVETPDSTEGELLRAAENRRNRRRSTGFARHATLSSTLAPTTLYGDIAP